MKQVKDEVSALAGKLKECPNVKEKLMTECLPKMREQFDSVTYKEILHAKEAEEEQDYEHEYETCLARA